MIDRKFLKSLVRLLDESSLDSLEIERGGTRIRLAKSPAGVVAVPAAPAAPAPPGVHTPPAPPAIASPETTSPPVRATPQTAATQAAAGQADQETAEAHSRSTLTEIVSPMVGTFYRAPSPEAEPYVRNGDAVAAGDVLCVIEAMKLMNELECEVSGKIVEVCVGNADPVDYGQVLFRVEAD